MMEDNDCGFKVAISDNLNRGRDGIFQNRNIHNSQKQNIN
jgi:hypothetical protein